ncbi:putative minor capsid protein [Enterococcus italicus]|uniref:putative minor capsid protein n=1 Tax=Enterococcus italicus TaxID=246144 RepID=UPI0028AA8BCD|nr:putative minor capsid protein [Enterococcus italicus]
MLFSPIPTHVLIHKVTYQPPTIEDDGSMGNGENPEKVEINHVRFAASRKKVTRTDNTEVLTNGILFIDAVNSDPFIIPSESGEIIFNGSKLTIVQVKEEYTDQMQPHHVEVMLQ